ncbi:MAG TPA: LuxR C-terminal-related transcriptional regulator [Pseudonocardiaceae bacterium]|jgi:DNA-binding CsgD family transcriptional regulator
MTMHPSLDALGLTEAEWLSYRLWLRNPAWNTSRMGKEIGITDDEAGVCRETLLCKGLVVVDQAEPERLLPVGSADVVEGLLAKAEANAATRRVEVLKARDELAAFLAFHLSERVEAPAMEIERVHSQPGIIPRIDELVRTAEREILVAHTKQPPCCAIMGSCRVLRPTTLERKVNVRAMYEHEKVADAVALTQLARLTDNGAQLRTIGQATGWSMVFDRATGIVPGRDGTVLVIHNDDIVTALTDSFEYSWSSAQPLRSAVVATSEDQPDRTVAERDRLLLTLLGLGLKDDAIAHQMGVSVRSVRRHVSTLLATLDVTSRFQAGVQAARRGWL